MANMFMVVDATSTLDFDLLTKHRVPGAIPFLGKYRMIDFTLSNATFSNITNVAVFAYGNYRSLTDHIGSGNRYNLDRRKDGIFILPPKNYSPSSEFYISFQRMREHLEYFMRSNQEYVIITPATLIWCSDLNEILEDHIKSGKDITQVVSSSSERLYTFILSKDKLMNYINSYDEISYRNLVEVFDYSPLESKNTYVYQGFASYIKSLHDYYEVSMQLIEKGTLGTLFEKVGRIRTKDPLNPPTFYGVDNHTENSFVSSGAIISGTVENSIISRRVIVKEGAKVINSIIMNNAVIEENAYLENVILDKETLVKKSARITGKKEDPFVSEKKQVVFSSFAPKVVILSAEASPFVKRGGLADMVGSLSRELSLSGAEVKVFLPLYREIKEKFSALLHLDNELSLTVDNKEYRINVYSYLEEKASYYFIDLYMFFDRGKIYGYQDDPYRFAYYTKAVCEYLSKISYTPDIIHFHDWHSSLLPLFIKQYENLKDTETILTIHNLNYQGTSDKDIISLFNLDYYVNGNTLNLLEVGINSADRITTVSKTYSEELKYAYYSGNLQEAILRRSMDLYGIVNGLDDKINPADDLEIKAQYNIDNVFLKKPINKKYLCDICGFDYDPDLFIIGMVSRIEEIKGFDLVLDSLDELLKDDKVRFVLLGTGSDSYMERLKRVEEKYPGKVKTFLEYYGTKPTYIYSGADVFLMPSRMEPCGTSQMIAEKYGTIPIVRQTGGLNDTVESFDNITLAGNGFKFFNYDARELINAVKIALEVYKGNKEGWMNLVRNSMKKDNSFERCAKEYLSLYMVKGKRKDQ